MQVSSFQDILWSVLRGYFSSAQIEVIESLVATIGETDPWGKIINLLWSELLEKIPP